MRLCFLRLGSNCKCRVLNEANSSCQRVFCFGLNDVFVFVFLAISAQADQNTTSKQGADQAGPSNAGGSAEPGTLRILLLHLFSSGKIVHFRTVF